LKLSNSYIDLGEQFYQRVLPQKVNAPKLLLWNGELANNLSISNEEQRDHALLSQHFSGNELPEGSVSIALAYSGHQFGHFNPQLGDGRAHLLGEVIDKKGIRRDIQLKGSGQTPFSRRGDGKCALAPALREYIMSEALYALGVPTSRCLAVVSTGEVINRGVAKAGAVVTRVAASHIRVGSFQYFAARGDTNALKSLLNYTIERHFPEIDSPDLSNSEMRGIENEIPFETRSLLFLEYAIDKQINVIVEWLRIGFIHGVMNTDNTAICGETIDFGPCAMMGSYDENTVFSSIDEYGRYAFGNQGKIGQWNMARLADCLLPLLIESHDEENSNDDDNSDDMDKEEQAIEKVKTVIHQYASKFDRAYYVMYAKKLGMNRASSVNKTLIDDLLVIMKEQKLDYTQTFHHLTQSLTDKIKEKEFNCQFGDWYEAWVAMLKEFEITKQEAKKLMAENNPVVIPRNHHIEALLGRCEQVVDDSEKTNAIDKQVIITNIVDEFLNVLRSPYIELEATKKYQVLAEDNDRYYQTFCGT
jgi:uncharacterized protein YdiU (UPF0061 family)